VLTDRNGGTGGWNTGPNDLVELAHLFRGCQSTQAQRFLRNQSLQAPITLTRFEQPSVLGEEENAMSLSRVWPVVVCVALLLAVPRSARADLSPPKDVEAKRFLLEGNTFYRLKEFDQAIKKYKEGAKIEDAPVFYYNIGQCLRQWKKYRAAMWFYRTYLGRGNVRPEVENVVRKFVASMQRELKKSASTDPPTRVVGVNGKKRRALTVKQPKKRRRQVKPAGAAWHNDWLGWAITGVGVAAGITGIVMFDSAGGLERKADAEPDQVLRDLYRSQASSRQTWGVVLSLASGAAIITGIVKLAITPNKTGEADNDLAVGLSVNGVMISGRF